IHALKLEDNKEFLLGPGWRSWWHKYTTSSAVAKGEAGGLNSDLEKQEQALKVFSKNLSVEAIGGTRIIGISYTNGDPKLAAAIANQLVQELVEYNFETGYKATEAASEALSKQLVDLRT